MDAEFAKKAQDRVLQECAKGGADIRLVLKDLVHEWERENPQEFAAFETTANSRIVELGWIEVQTVRALLSRARMFLNTVETADAAIAARRDMIACDCNAWSKLLLEKLAGSAGEGR